MKYAKILTNDVVNGNNICVSLFVQGCHKHCKNCFNPETWDFNGGQEITTSKLIDKIISAINKNGVQRNFSILGGEPLCNENVDNVTKIIKAVKEEYPDIQIWVWTGYTVEELQEQHNLNMDYILSTIDILIDGEYIDEEKDLSLLYRGSRNQRIILFPK